MVEVDDETGGTDGFATLLLIVNVVVLVALFGGVCVEVAILYQDLGETASAHVKENKHVQRILSHPSLARVLSAKPRSFRDDASFDHDDDHGISMSSIHASKKTEYFQNPLQSQEGPNQTVGGVDGSVLLKKTLN